MCIVIYNLYKNDKKPKRWPREINPKNVYVNVKILISKKYFLLLLYMYFLICFIYLVRVKMYKI